MLPINFTNCGSDAVHSLNLTEPRCQCISVLQYWSLSKKRCVCRNGMDGASCDQWLMSWMEILLTLIVGVIFAIQCYLLLKLWVRCWRKYYGTSAGSPISEKERVGRRSTSYGGPGLCCRCCCKSKLETSAVRMEDIFSEIRQADEHEVQYVDNLPFQPINKLLGRSTPHLYDDWVFPKVSPTVYQSSIDGYLESMTPSPLEQKYFGGSAQDHHTNVVLREMSTSREQRPLTTFSQSSTGSPASYDPRTGSSAVPNASGQDKQYLKRGSEPILAYGHIPIEQPLDNSTACTTTDQKSKKYQIPKHHSLVRQMKRRRNSEDHHSKKGPLERNGMHCNDNQQQDVFVFPPVQNPPMKEISPNYLKESQTLQQSTTSRSPKKIKPSDKTEPGRPSDETRQSDESLKDATGIGNLESAIETQSVGYQHDRSTNNRSKDNLTNDPGTKRISTPEVVMYKSPVLVKNIPVSPSSNVGRVKPAKDQTRVSYLINKLESMNPSSSNIHNDTYPFYSGYDPNKAATSSDPRNDPGDRLSTSLTEHSQKIQIPRSRQPFWGNRDTVKL